MPNAIISADTLKTLRKSRKIGRPKLAKLSGLTERQVARFEGATGSETAATGEVIARLTAALGVSAEVLIGTSALTDYDLVSAPKPSCSCCG